MSRAGRSGMRKVDHKIITRTVWCILKSSTTQVRGKNFREYLEAYMGERPSEEFLDAAVAFKKNTHNLARFGRESIPVSFGHKIIRDILSENDVDQLRGLVGFLEENHQAFAGGSLLTGGEASWLTWHVEHLDLDVVSDIQEKKSKTHSEECSITMHMTTKQKK